MTSSADSGSVLFAKAGYIRVQQGLDLVLSSTAAILRICTVKLQWLKHLWNHINFFQTWKVGATDIALVKALFFNLKVLILFLFLHKNIRCGYSLEAPQLGTSNEYPQHMFSWRNKKNIYRIPSLI